MSKQLIFIDDSGDPGFKVDSSENFVMTAALFVDTNVAESIMREISKYRKELKWQQNHEFKFRKNPKPIIVELLKRISHYNFKVYAVYIKKSHFQKIDAGLLPFFNKEKLYNWAIKELLKEIPLKNAKITIDGRSSKQNMNKTKTYLRQEINNSQIKLDIKFEDSVKTDLLQLADLISGAINRSLQLDKTDSKKYIKIIDSKIEIIRRLTFK